jgi:hypothetical protein
LLALNKAVLRAKCCALHIPVTENDAAYKSKEFGKQDLARKLEVISNKATKIEELDRMLLTCDAGQFDAFMAKKRKLEKDLLDFM